jgi:hypothetical protein
MRGSRVAKSQISDVHVLGRLLLLLMRGWSWSKNLAFLPTTRRVKT